MSGFEGEARLLAHPSVAPEDVKFFQAEIERARIGLPEPEDSEKAKRSKLLWFIPFIFVGVFAFPMLGPSMPIIEQNYWAGIDCSVITKGDCDHHNHLYPKFKAQCESCDEALNKATLVKSIASSTHKWRTLEYRISPRHRALPYSLHLSHDLSRGPITIESFVLLVSILCPKPNCRSCPLAGVGAAIMFGCAPLFGKLSDSFGRKPLLIVSAIMSLVGPTVCIPAPWLRLC
jgi:hypothetical protein